MKIRPHVDLGAAFERLKESLAEVENRRKEQESYGYAYGYGYLSAAIKSHIFECTGIDLYEKPKPEIDKDDLKHVNI